MVEGKINNSLLLLTKHNSLDDRYKYRKSFILFT